MKYEEFLRSKRFSLENIGGDYSDDEIHPMLFPFQRDIVRWAAKKGRCAVFLDTGLGKTFIQLEWARLMGEKTLIIAPLSVAKQTIREARKIDITVKYCRYQEETGPGINITNYEMIDNFASDFGAIILDESSILKSLSGVTKKKLIDKFGKIKLKLCCTATPAPNDFIELGNHTHFLNICTMQEMLALFFINANKEHTIIHDGQIFTKKGSNKGGQEHRLKHHAEQAFFSWMAKWSITMTKPSDLGYEDGGFDLPPLNITPLFVKFSYKPEGELFFTHLSGLGDRANIRKQSIESKIGIMQDVLSRAEGQSIVWCGLDDEARAIRQSLNGDCRFEVKAFEVKGVDSPEHKAQSFEDFQDGKFDVLITKPKIGGFGMNFQNANNMIFFGLNDSWETYYQAIRREWRFGQTKPVNVFIILSEQEREILKNIERKENQNIRLKTNMIAQLRNYEKEELMGGAEVKIPYKEETIKQDGWTAMMGDSVVRMKEVKDDSVDMSVYSPPFADLFVYSNSERDLGNSKNWDEFFEHYSFIAKEVFRSTKPGRLSCVHTSDIPAMANRDGYIGLRDFPGRVIALHQEMGWVFTGRCFIQKNPQAQAIRVKSKSLLFVQVNKDSSHSRPALVDQVLIFKKPGENQVPITPSKNGDLDNEKWISWAHGIWTDIQETETLQFYSARAREDEKHICPLQLGTIERCIKLYSNPGELVLSPFMGIGSEIFMAIKLGRRGVGIELKESYFREAVKNLQSIQSTLL